jgi:hypothetical protein
MHLLDVIPVVHNLRGASVSLVLLGDSHLDQADLTIRPSGSQSIAEVVEPFRSD